MIRVAAPEMVGRAEGTSRIVFSVLRAEAFVVPLVKKKHRGKYSILDTPLRRGGVGNEDEVAHQREEEARK